MGATQLAPPDKKWHAFLAMCQNALEVPNRIVDIIFPHNAVPQTEAHEDSSSKARKHTISFMNRQMKAELGEVWKISLEKVTEGLAHPISAYIARIIKEACFNFDKGDPENSRTNSCSASDIGYRDVMYVLDDSTNEEYKVLGGIKDSTYRLKHGVDATFRIQKNQRDRAATRGGRVLQRGAGTTKNLNLNIFSSEQKEEAPISDAPLSWEAAKANPEELVESAARICKLLESFRPLLRICASECETKLGAKADSEREEVSASFNCGKEEEEEEEMKRRVENYVPDAPSMFYVFASTMANGIDTFCCLLEALYRSSSTTESLAIRGMCVSAIEILRKGWGETCRSIYLDLRKSRSCLNDFEDKLILKARSRITECEVMLAQNITKDFTSELSLVVIPGIDCVNWQQERDNIAGTRLTYGASAWCALICKAANTLNILGARGESFSSASEKCKLLAGEVFSKILKDCVKAFMIR